MSQKARRGQGRVVGMQTDCLRGMEHIRIRRVSLRRSREDMSVVRVTLKPFGFFHFVQIRHNWLGNQEFRAPIMDE